MSSWIFLTLNADGGCFATYGDAEPEFLEITEGFFIAAMGLGHHPPS
jgi:hypothetical protein